MQINCPPIFQMKSEVYNIEEGKLIFIAKLNAEKLSLKNVQKMCSFNYSKSESAHTQSSGSLILKDNI